MAKFRTNHARGNRGAASGGMVVKVGLFSAIIAGLFWLFNLFGGGGAASAETEETYLGEDYYLPTGSKGQIVRHKYFTLSYNEDHEQADWVAYILTRDRLEQEWNARNEDFRPDPAVRTQSATLEDYRGSGYDRGHLAPAADMAFDPQALSETFYLSNITPQARNFNQGIWRELEELTRDWARKDGQLYVVSGPILRRPPKGAIGPNEVSIPSAYFKVLLDLDEPQRKAIGFILANQVNYEPLYKFAVSVDEVEAATGFNFFADLMPPDVEAAVESELNIDLWSFNKRKYDQRVNEWNKVE